MASEQLRAVFEAVETISETVESIEQSISSLDREIDSLSASMQGNTISSQQQEASIESLGNTVDDLSDEYEQASRQLTALTGSQSVNIATAMTQKGSLEMAADAIDDAGDEAMKTGAQMGVLDTVMKELSLTGSALSVNIGAFNVSLRNLAPLVPIAASMGTVVAAAGAFVVAIGNATVALAAFTTAGAISFLEDMQAEFAGLTDQAETMEAVMGGIKDLFAEAFEPLTDMPGASQIFVNFIEGLADLVNRFAQAVRQMRGIFMPFFGEIASLVNREFDRINTAFANTASDMLPILADFVEWFLVKLPGAIEFMTMVVTELAGPLSNLGQSLLHILTSIINITISIMQGLAPALTVAADTANAIAGIIDTLGNGFLQATLFVGMLSLAASKFVGVANLLANVGLSAANSMIQFGKSAGSLSGSMGILNSSLANAFPHLDALGKVLTGEMSIADAAGQTHRDLAKDIQTAAEKMNELENRLQDVTQKYAQLVATVEGTSVGEEIADEVDEATNSIQRNSAQMNMPMDINADPLHDSTDEAVAGFDRLSESADEAGDAISGGAMKPPGAAIRSGGAGLDIATDIPDVDMRDAYNFDEMREEMRTLPRLGGGDMEDMFSVKDGTTPARRDIDRLKGAFSTVGDSVSGAAESVEAFGDADIDTKNINKIRSKFSGLGSTATTAASGIIGGFKTAGAKFNKFSKRVRSGVGSIISGMQVAAGAVAEAMVLMAKKMIQTTFASGLLNIAQGNVITGFKMMARSAYGAVKGLVLSAGSSLTAAASFLTGAGAASVFGAALNAALFGIPAILAAIVAAGAAVVGVLGNMDAITSSASSAFEGLKSGLKAIGAAIMKAAVPAWNAFINVVEMVLAPVFALWDGIKLIAQAFGLMEEGASSSGGVLSTLIGLFDLIMAVTGDFISFVAPAFDAVGSVIYNAIFIPLQLIAGMIRTVKSVFSALSSFIMDNIPGISESVNILATAFETVKNALAAIPSVLANFAKLAQQVFNGILGGLEDILEGALGVINDLIDKANKVPWVDINNVNENVDLGGDNQQLQEAQTTASEARENMSGDDEEEDEQVKTEPKVDLSLEDSVENNVDVKADPEDTAQLSRIAKDALEEANSFARRQQGG